MEYQKPEIIKLSSTKDDSGIVQTTGNEKPKHCVIGSDPKEKGCTNGGSHKNFCATGADPG